MSVEQHRKEAPKTVRCMILTISDTRTYDTDKSGALIRELLEAKGHQVTEYQIVKDEYSQIQHWLKVAAGRADIDAILLNGGTGIALRDTTYEAVRDSLDKEMPGFGEIFRLLSFQEDIGTAAILSRAIAGVRDGKAIFSMPGSTGAVKLAMTRIIIPELGHVMREILKDR
ncbi:molybdenum cofactor biosynthesis protein MoaB [Halalkalibacterium halodurans]|uniref:Molybdenum cofactor biosynthesis protein B n=2 Tax=Halalkalibacterium halodurans TaxID=86665 RepID=MOAB_HALH5|nr:molybdenum cofactor biosynthesis protein B [Halalkalibacterium halodurans]Q9K8I4.1 RecName: Full=Molybdenum cofactor biosynthesis protein B [Halalkalibacterium halodurans C-125]MDY7223567.1 molybdenum cofactor biosynthesis protein B [Halalkalibacterium halodurans]MDY7242788.1 molybdenum cofactor biosynthesis protein B [Halalkalibacterium halodurans]MED3646587.1 molybdenum cofactor biosynthesis protein MoaB [Halalkalibacterium halodurans]MED4082226.1 molybdenum cofactor biosynthesis protein 